MSSTSRRIRCTAAETAAALDALDHRPVRVAASAWPGSLGPLDQPGLYSWWVDEVGAHDLTSGLGAPLDPGRIYAGQTGATKWPSGKVGTMTLRDRIGGNHLRGTIYGSTFRKTLASVLRLPLGLEIVGPKRLTRSSEQTLSVWIKAHLDIAVHPFPERDPLGDLERHVLTRLNPPLNLDGMASTPLRSLLAIRRRELRSIGAETSPTVESPP